MKIISYNVNGIRAAETKGLSEWLIETSADIICLQETKAQPEQIDTNTYEKAGYNVYLNSAQKKGYSGVALISKIKPKKISYGMGIEKFDVEGRIIKADFKDFTQISVYIPSGSMGDLRQDFKIEFLYAFSKYISNVLNEQPNLIVSGDYNICHKPIDINHPERHKNSSGFLPEEREWFDSFIDLGMNDSFRMFNNQPNQYSWWSYRQRAREKNLGWRIDYNMASNAIKNKVLGATILSSIVHSDHCPVVLDLKS